LEFNHALCNGNRVILKVCYLIGPEPRSQIIRKGLRKNGVEVVELHRALKPWRFLNDCCRKEKYDAILVAEYGHIFVPQAKLLKKISRSTLLIFDPYISIYDTYAHDRKLIEVTSLKAKYYFLLDKYACNLADMCLLDTNEHIKYFSENFGLDPWKFRRVFVGADDDIFYPRQVKRKDDLFTVFWYGTYIPLHGAEYIVRAAKILEKYKDIRFVMVGRGQTYAQMRKLAELLRASNIEFVNWIEYTHLPIYMAKADVCLGIFGNTGKASRVIPNKVFQALAVKKPIITGDTPAAREALSHMENAYLCDKESQESIAEAVLALKEDEALRGKLAENGYQLFVNRFAIEPIGSFVKGILREALN
jgi:glycosyltransferase involved in cell wall biosynthesis